MAKPKDLKLICRECGKEAPIDTEKSTAQWVVYKSSTCSCGGKEAPIDTEKSTAQWVVYKLSTCSCGGKCDLTKA